MSMMKQASALVAATLLLGQESKAQGAPLDELKPPSGVPARSEKGIRLGIGGYGIGLIGYSPAKGQAPAQQSGSTVPVTVSPAPANQTPAPIYNYDQKSWPVLSTPPPSATTVQAAPPPAPATAAPAPVTQNFQVVTAPPTAPAPAVAQSTAPVFVAQSQHQWAQELTPPPQAAQMNQVPQQWVQPVIGKTRVTDTRHSKITPYGRTIVSGGSTVRTTYSQPVYGEAVPLEPVVVAPRNSTHHQPKVSRSSQRSAHNAPSSQPDDGGAGPKYYGTK